MIGAVGAFGIGVSDIEEILLPHGLHYSNEPSADLAEESASFPKWLE
jgi:hypothetical protein